jgi:hypothetical protein
MGLDMYLYGVDEGEDEELGYWRKPCASWRKHPDLHGYFVNEFADGLDECQRIPLTVDNLKAALNATVEGTLPFTAGFFFGTCQPEDRAETIEILQRAIKWLSEGSGRTVYYRASW